MLSQADNALLTQTGPGTPMGELMRQYWLPVLLSEELPTPDGPPARVRLLGEDLVAFRDSAGRVGLLGAHCAHRGAALFFGRNEADGLRCVYHGWKYDVSGRCVDLPTEPPASPLQARIRQRAYHCRERGGIIWAYLGSRAEPPPLPGLEWVALPPEQRYITKRWAECNYTQGLEGDLDSSHVGFLHARRDPFQLAPDAQVWGASGTFTRFSQDLQPRFETRESAAGLMIAARRAAGPDRSGSDRYYWRVTQFLLPCFTLIPPFGDDATIRAKAWVPIDDTTHMNWTISAHPVRPLAEAERAVLRSGATAHVGVDLFLPPTPAPGGRWRATAHRDNDFLLDRQAQRTESFSGLPGNWGQDGGIIASMGETFDRSQEHLGTSDTGVIRVRELLLRSARALRDRGTMPPGVSAPESYRVRAVSLELPHDAPWVAHVHEQTAPPVP
jgi:phenylpropionate dioxygenase-like ring-hydroxylating dioxygenase large terminal subunit